MKLILISISILIGQILFAQSVLKIHIGGGYYTSFSGLPADGSNTLEQSESNGTIMFNSRKTLALYDNVEYPFYVEYEHNQNWSVSSGIILNSFAPVSLYYDIPTANSNISPGTGTYPAGTTRDGIISGIGLTKIPFLFSIKMFRFGSSHDKIAENEKAFFVQTNLVLGGGLWFRKGRRMSSNSFWEREVLWISSSPIEDINGNSYQLRAEAPVLHKFSGCLTASINFSFRTRKHEYAKFHITYEQGLVPVTGIWLPYYYTENGKTYNFNGPYSFTRGSNLSFRLSFPIFTYNFTKKKFYRD